MFSSATVDTTNHKVVLAFPVNANTSSKQSTITLSGVGNNGDSVSSTATLTQAGSSPSASITITPPSKTVSRTDVYTTFTITTSGTVNNLMMTTTSF